MKKRMLAFLLSMVMVGGAIASTAAIAKTKKFSPKDSMEHFETVAESAMDAVANYVDANEDKEFNEEQVGSWGYIALYLTETAYDTYERAVYAEENPGESEKEGDKQFSTTRTADYYIFEAEEKIYDEDTKKDVTRSAKTHYYRLFDRITSAFKVSGIKGESEIVDVVNTEKNVYLQDATFVPAIDGDPSYYAVYRMFVGSNKIYISYAELTKAELLESRVSSGYETPDAFMFNEGNSFSFDGKNLVVLDENGVDVTFAKSVSPQAD